MDEWAPVVLLKEREDVVNPAKRVCCCTVKERVDVPILHCQEKRQTSYTVVVLRRNFHCDEDQGYDDTNDYAQDKCQVDDVVSPTMLRSAKSNMSLVRTKKLPQARLGGSCLCSRKC